MQRSRKTVGIFPGSRSEAQHRCAARQPAIAVCTERARPLGQYQAYDRKGWNKQKLILENVNWPRAHTGRGSARRCRDSDGVGSRQSGPDQSPLK